MGAMTVPNPFGVLDFLSWDHDWNQHHYSQASVEKAGHFMRDSGVDFVRMDFLWSDIEPRPNEFTFAKYDQLVDALARHDLQVLGLLNYTPLWRAVHWNSAPLIDDY